MHTIAIMGRMRSTWRLIVLAAFLLPVALAACGNQPAKQASVHSHISAATGGTITIGSATLAIPPNALKGDATVTLTDSGRKLIAADPNLPIASDIFQLDTRGANGQSVDFANGTATLTIKPNAINLAQAQDVVVAMTIPTHPNTVNILHSDGATDDAGKSLAALKLRYLVPGTRAWLADIPQQPGALNLATPAFTTPTSLTYGAQTSNVRGATLSTPLTAASPRTPFPTTTPYLNVPYYEQDQYTWCVPTSLSEFLNYYNAQSLGVHSTDTLDAFFGNHSLANWELAALNHQDPTSGTFDSDLMNNAGISSDHFVSYNWDPTFIPDNRNATSDFDSYVANTAGTSAPSADQQRPVAIGVGSIWNASWGHELTLVGSDTNGLYLHDTNGYIGVYVTWGRLNQLLNTDYNTVFASGYSGSTDPHHPPPPEIPGSNHWPNLPYVTTLAMLGTPTVRPAVERSGSIVLMARDSDNTASPFQWIDGIPGQRPLRLAWDGSGNHTHGYYWDYWTDSSTDHPTADLGGIAAPAATFHYHFYVANPTTVQQSYTAVVEIRRGDGSYAVTQSQSYPFSLDAKGLIDVINTMKLPLGGPQAIFDVKLYAGTSQLIDVKYERIPLTGKHAGPYVTIRFPADGTHAAYPLPFALQANATDGYNNPLPTNNIVWVIADSGGHIVHATGNAPTFTPSAPGRYTVRVTGTDSDNVSTTATITLTSDAPPTITQPPQLTVSAPTDGATFHVGDSVAFAATAVQPETHLLLPSSAINWYFNGSSTPLHTGGSFSRTFTGVGDVAVLVTATNTAGYTASQHLTLHILSGGGPATLTINAPANNAVFYITSGTTVPVNFAATATGGITQIRWFDDATGGSQIGTGPSITANLADPDPTCGTMHHIRAVGYHGSTVVANASVNVEVYACIP